MPPNKCGTCATDGSRCGLSPVVTVTRRRQPAGTSVMVGYTAMSWRVSWPGTTAAADCWVRGWTGSSTAPDAVVHVRVGSVARSEPSRAPEDMGKLVPLGATASTVAASSVSEVFAFTYTVASIGPATTSGAANGVDVYTNDPGPAPSVTSLRSHGSLEPSDWKPRASAPAPHWSVWMSHGLDTPVQSTRSDLEPEPEPGPDPG